MRLAATALCGVLLVACGADDEGWSESEVEREAKQWYDLEFPGEHAVDCPGGLAGEDDARVECELDTDGKVTRVTVSVEGTSDGVHLRFTGPDGESL